VRLEGGKGGGRKVEGGWRELEGGWREAGGRLEGGRREPVTFDKGESRKKN
jgi:hypothetical protein